MGTARTLRKLQIVLLLVAFGAVTLGGCAHSQRRLAEDQYPRTLDELLNQHIDAVPPVGKPVAVPNKIAVRGVELENTSFDIPIRVNSRVEKWVDYFTGRGRVHFEKYLERSEYFIPYILPLLKENGMPLDLVYLALIESGFHNHARSHARAVGPWQFIAATGKHYGLRIDWWVDERRDTHKSTLSAIAYLRELYSIFGAWELAAAAYNAGERKIMHAIRRYGSHDYWVISRQSFLRPETRNYYPKIIAAALVAKNRTQFGFPPARERQLNPGEMLAGDGQLVKVEKRDDDLQPTPIPQGKMNAEELAAREIEQKISDEEDVRTAASETEEDAVVAETAPDESEFGDDEAVVLEGRKPIEYTSASPIEPTLLARVVPTPLVSRKGEVSGEAVVEFEIVGPADLLKVAKAAGLSYHTVKSLNPEILRWCTPPDSKTYRIKLPASVKEKFLVTYNHEAFDREVKFRRYRVKRGDTIYRIARRFGIHSTMIASINGISRRTPLVAGAYLKLPLPEDRHQYLSEDDTVQPRHRGKPARVHKVSLKDRQRAKRVY